jgi:hypothetical protein
MYEIGTSTTAQSTTVIVTSSGRGSSRVASAWALIAGPPGRAFLALRPLRSLRRGRSSPATFLMDVKTDGPQVDEQRNQHENQ